LEARVLRDHEAETLFQAYLGVKSQFLAGQGDIGAQARDPCLALAIRETMGV
jgi:hypothetical protein